MSQTSGTQQSVFGFTGEETDGNGLVNLRARYYNPTLGLFPSLDPLEGASCTPMSINRYMYVQGNVVNRVDPSGQCWENSESTFEQRKQCLNAWADYEHYLSRVYGSASSWNANVINSYNKEKQFWAPLSYEDFSALWNDRNIMPSEPQNPTQGAAETIAGGGVGITLAVPEGGELVTLAALLAAGCVYAIGAIVKSGAFRLPGRPTYNFARGNNTGERITWGADYQAAKDAAGACIACEALQLTNPKFCNVNIISGEGCTGAHMHVFRFNQDRACNCRIQPDKPFVICLASPYAGPPGGPYFPAISGVPNPELAICTGGWNQT